MASRICSGRCVHRAQGRRPPPGRRNAAPARSGAFRTALRRCRPARGRRPTGGATGRGQPGAESQIGSRSAQARRPQAGLRHSVSPSPPSHPPTPAGPRKYCGRPGGMELPRPPPTATFPAPYALAGPRRLLRIAAHAACGAASPLHAFRAPSSRRSYFPPRRRSCRRPRRRAARGTARRPSRCPARRTCCAPTVPGAPALAILGLAIRPHARPGQPPMSCAHREGMGRCACARPSLSSPQGLAGCMRKSLARLRSLATPLARLCPSRIPNCSHAHVRNAGFACKASKTCFQGYRRHAYPFLPARPPPRRQVWRGTAGGGEKRCTRGQGGALQPSAREMGGGRWSIEPGPCIIEGRMRCAAPAGTGGGRSSQAPASLKGACAVPHRQAREVVDRARPLHHWRAESGVFRAAPSTPRPLIAAVAASSRQVVPRTRRRAKCARRAGLDVKGPRAAAPVFSCECPAIPWRPAEPPRGQCSRSPPGNQGRRHDAGGGQDRAGRVTDRGQGGKPPSPHGLLPPPRARAPLAPYIQIAYCAAGQGIAADT